MFSFGLDDNPDYQRGYVWGEHEQTELLNSIFLGVEIGKIVLVELPFNPDVPYSYEVLDGKQRLQTIKLFRTGRLKYKGRSYFDLSWYDRNRFDDSPVTLGIVRENKLKTKLEYFVRLNRHGKVMDSEHLKKVEEYAASL